MDMDETEKRKQIEFYIGKLQKLLSKVISGSKEFQELKRLMNTQDSEIQFCVFSLMMDKQSAGFLKNMDMEQLQKMIMQAYQAQEQLEDIEPLGEGSWTDEDRQFLKDIKIIL